MTETSKQPEQRRQQYWPRLRKHIHALEPALESETFVVPDLDPKPEGVNRAVKIAKQQGALKKVGSVQADYSSSVGLTYRARWKWVNGAREQLREYAEGLDRLPCGHSKHVPDSRDDPDGVISCKYCGREYPEERFKELVLDG